MIHPGLVSPSACVFIIRFFLKISLSLLSSPSSVLSLPVCLAALPAPAWLSGAASGRYAGTVVPDRLQMSSCHVVMWHLEQIPGGVQFEVLIKVPHKALLRK